MKKLLLIACFAIATFAQAQITKVHQYDENVFYYNGYGTEKIYSYQSNAKMCILYNTDFTLNKQITLQLPEGYGISTMQFISKNILTNDSKIAFIVTSFCSTAPDNQKQHIAAYNEDGEMVYDFGYGQVAFGTTICEFNNHYYAFVRFGTLNTQINAYDYTTDIYQLYGTPTQTSSAAPQIQQVPQLPYPNPANGIITLPYNLQQEVGSLYIYDQTGKQIDRRHITRGNNQLQLNVSNYPAGQYIYTVEGQAQSFIVK